MKKYIIFLFSICLSCGSVYANVPEPSESDLPDTYCIQVVTYARNPETLTWITFPTPCDVPHGWTSSATPPEGYSRAMLYSREDLDTAREEGFQQGLARGSARGNLSMEDDYSSGQLKRYRPTSYVADY